MKTVVISANATSSRTTTRNSRYSNNHVNRNDVNSSTVLVFSYRCEHAEDKIPVCRGCVGGWENDSLVLTLDRQKKTTLSGTVRHGAMHGPMKAWFAAIFYFF